VEYGSHKDDDNTEDDEHGTRLAIYVSCFLSLSGDLSKNVDKPEESKRKKVKQRKIIIEDEPDDDSGENGNKGDSDDEYAEDLGGPCDNISDCSIGTLQASLLCNNSSSDVLLFVYW
jgi:hypothetical protein